MPSISCRNYFFNFILVQTWLIFHKNGFALSFILKKVKVLKLENGLFFRIFSNGSLRLFSDMCAWSLTSIPMVWVKTTILADSMRITKLSKKTNSERKEMLLVRIQSSWGLKKRTSVSFWTEKIFVESTYPGKRYDSSSLPLIFSWGTSKTEEALVLELSLNFVLLNHRREFSDQARHFWLRKFLKKLRWCVGGRV